MSDTTGVNKYFNQEITDFMKRNSSYKGLGLSFLLSLFFFTSSAQIVITDTGNCLSHVLHASLSGTIPTASGITADDGYSGLIPIGFTFNFYGTNYTQLVIGSNGLLSFTPTLAGAYCPWPISAALLGNASARNSICGPWCDILLSAGGSITYSTMGTAPNRKFAVTWCGTAMYSCTAQYTTSQIIIYETSNLIEVHTAHKTICAWNGGYAITGVQNATGTQATVAPGRDFPAVWSVVSPPEAWQFTSTGPSYTVTSIPYAPAPYATSAIYWYDSSTGAYLGTGPYLTVTPTVGTTYKAAALGCNDTTFAYIHVMPPSAGVGGIPHITNATSTDPTECGKCDGSITLHGVNPHQIDSIFYSIGGVAQPIRVDSALLDSTITLTGLCGGVYDYIYVKVANCPSNQVGPITLTTPVLAIWRDTHVDPSICGRFDGSFTLYGLTPAKPYSLAYTKGGVAQTPATGIVAADSSITVTGLEAGTYAGFAATVGLCTATWGTIVITDPPPYPASFTVSQRLGCSGDTVFVTNTSTPAGFFSYWDYEPGATMDSLHTFHVYADHLNPTPYVGSYSITLTYNTTNFHKVNCQTTVTVPVNFDHHIIAQFTENLDTTCADIAIPFVNTTSSANPSTLLWSFGDGGTSTETDPEHPYALAGVYVTTLTATDSIVGCKSSYTHSAYIVSVTLKAPADTFVCLRDSMLMRVGELTIEGQGIVTYEWTMADGSPATNLNDNHIKYPTFYGVGSFPYNLTVTLFPAVTKQLAGCTASDVHTVNSFPPLVLSNLTASPQVIMYGSTVQLNASGAKFYTWTPNNGTLSNPDISNPIAKPTDSVTTYVVHGMTEYGCVDSAIVRVLVDYDNTDFIPTGFTPNGDGKNDKFRPAKFKFQRLVEMRVYNRWGQLLFQSSNPEDGWDGAFNGVPQDLGTYFYEVIVARADGSQKIYKGNVTLIR